MDYLTKLLQSFRPEQAIMSPYTQGMMGQGNIDLANRPRIPTKNGGYQTVYTMTAGIDNGKVVLLPRIVNGKILSEQEALNHYRKSGEHMGLFHSQKAADAYDKKLHKDMGWIGKANKWKD
jgi:hypothetical protein